MPPAAEPSAPAEGGGPPQASGPQAGEADDSASRINVAVRCRPLSDGERSSGAKDVIRVMDHRLVILMDPGQAHSNDYLRQDKSREKRYAFDHAFGPDVGNQDVFEATAKPLIGAVMHAYNATIFAYGSTGAGKTFTMIGTPNEPGVMLRTVMALFEQAAAVRQGSGGVGRAVAVRCSFMEVYNENLRDLLSEDPHEGYLDLREDPDKGTCVAGVTETEAESADEVMSLLQTGNRRRTTEPTAMNVTSSRSHAVLQVAVEQREPGQVRVVLLGKLSMIDLAGSERASQTDNRGARLIEGANINRSLLALGNCINALASGGSFVPYRDSKLTRLLKDSLGGNCRTVMIANVSPSHHSFEDTLNTLKYANRAKNIRVSARQNRIQPDSHVSEYEKAIGDLRNEVKLLRSKLAQREAPAAPLKEEGGAGDESELTEASEHWKVEVVKNLECRTQLQRSLIEVDRGLARWRVERETAQAAIAQWEAQAAPISPKTSRFGGQPASLEDWREQLAQIDESIRENMETRKSLEERLQQNKAAGKELQAQLPQRVLNEDLRAFLELIQRVQVLEVERLELDHMWERQRLQLEDRDQEIAMLRQQLRLRNEHLRAQRERLSAEKKRNLPERVSLLGSTLAGPSPVQQRGPLRVMHAWAPHPLDHEDLSKWDNRPLRERPPQAQWTPTNDDSAGASAGAGAGGGLPSIISAAQGIDWRNLQVPRASQIRGIARIQPPGSYNRLAPKGWREPPELRPSPVPPPLPIHIPGPNAKPATSSAVPSGGQASCSPRRRGNTCPPLRRPASLEAGHHAHHRRAVGLPEDVAEPPRRVHRGGVGIPGSVRNSVSHVPSLPRSSQREHTPGQRRRRARSEHLGHPARHAHVRAGQGLLHTPGR